MMNKLFKNTQPIICIGWVITIITYTFFAIPTYILAIMYYIKQLGL
jgi:hypothetical protein